MTRALLFVFHERTFCPGFEPTSRGPTLDHFPRPRFSPLPGFRQPSASTSLAVTPVCKAAGTCGEPTLARCTMSAAGSLAGRCAMLRAVKQALAERQTPTARTGDFLSNLHRSADQHTRGRDGHTKVRGHTGQSPVEARKVGADMFHRHLRRMHALLIDASCYGARCDPCERRS